MRALLIANSADADPGYVGERFRHHGFAFTECHRERPAEWPTLEGIDLVLLLGSEWSVYWPEVAGNIRAEADLIREAHRRNTALFGICFGHQTMAHALGGAVLRANAPEIGWHDVITDAPAWIASGPWLQWHYDIVTVPPGATELAHNVIGPQAWQCGNSFATQFHPEATETMLARWTKGPGAAELATVGSSAEQVMAETRSNVDVSRVQSDHLVDGFLEGLSRRVSPAC